MTLRFFYYKHVHGTFALSMVLNLLFVLSLGSVRVPFGIGREKVFKFL